MASLEVILFISFYLFVNVVLKKSDVLSGNSSTFKTFNFVVPGVVSIKIDSEPSSYSSMVNCLIFDGSILLLIFSYTSMLNWSAYPALESFLA